MREESNRSKLSLLSPALISVSTIRPRLDQVWDSKSLIVVLVQRDRLIKMVHSLPTHEYYLNTKALTASAVRRHNCDAATSGKNVST